MEHWHSLRIQVSAAAMLCLFPSTGFFLPYVFTWEHIGHKDMQCSWWMCGEEHCAQNIRPSSCFMYHFSSCFTRQLYFTFARQNSHFTLSVEAFNMMFTKFTKWHPTLERSKSCESWFTQAETMSEGKELHVFFFFTVSETSPWTVSTAQICFIFLVLQIITQGWISCRASELLQPLVPESKMGTSLLA